MSDQGNKHSEPIAALSNAQQRYLQTIFDYFHENAEWPKRRYLERTLLKEDLNAREIATSLMVRIGHSPYADAWDPDREATLSIADMMLCQGSQEEMDAFIQAFRLCADLYLSEDDPKVTNLDLITRLHMPDTMARKVGKLFLVEPVPYSQFSDGTTGWTMTLSQNMFQYRKVQSLGDYLALRPAPTQPSFVSIGGGAFLPESSFEGAASLAMTNTASSRGVFIVHGHDDDAREATAHFIGSLGFNPIILHEKPNEGLTIIEKFEKHANVAFAVVLLTPDDIGAPKEAPDAMKPRARQNVVLELGYFLAKLGRGHVCALHKGNVELPSDYHGVLYIPMDEHERWKLQLQQEIKAAGLEATGDGS